jgi:hypothetical protein
MHPLPSNQLARALAVVSAAMLFAACAADAPVAPTAIPRAAMTEESALILRLQRASARYHSLEVAIKDGFTLLHACEDRPGEGPVGMVYVSFERVLDGVIDPDSPDALIYEPSAFGPPKLVGVEFAVLDAGQPAPELFGQTFQAEDEFGVYGLHAWVWRENPEGLFAEANPRVSCGDA